MECFCVVWCVINDMILLIMRKIVLRKSHAFKLPAMETRRQSSIKRRVKEIYAVVCVEVGVTNLLGERCCVEYCP